MRQDRRHVGTQHAYLMHLFRTEEETESVHFLNSTQQYTIQMGEEASEYYRVNV